MRSLLKYDFKYIWRVWWIAGLVMLIMTIVGTASMRGIISMEGGTVAASSFGAVYSETVVPTLCILGMVLFCISLVAFGIASFILIMFRYYKNFFTDEGYLTFTLPVSENQHLMAKSISGFVWSVLTVLAEVLCVLIFVLFGTGDTDIVNKEVLSALGQFFPAMNHYIGGYTIGYTVELVVLLLVSTAFGLLLGYLSITIGAMIAKKHKLLAGIGIYFGINILISIFSNIGGTVFMFGLFENESMTDTQGMLLISGILIGLILITAAATVGLYFLIKALLKRRLNLA